MTQILFIKLCFSEIHVKYFKLGDKTTNEFFLTHLFSKNGGKGQKGQYLKSFIFGLCSVRGIFILCKAMQERLMMIV
jgi:hypothetical protein